jgi:hypothetical protein
VSRHGLHWALLGSVGEVVRGYSHPLSPYHRVAPATSDKYCTCAASRRATLTTMAPPATALPTLPCSHCCRPARVVELINRSFGSWTCRLSCRPHTSAYYSSSDTTRSSTPDNMLAGRLCLRAIMASKQGSPPVRQCSTSGPSVSRPLHVPSKQRSHCDSVRHASAERADSWTPPPPQYVYLSHRAQPTLRVACMSNQGRRHKTLPLYQPSLQVPAHKLSG